MNQQFEQKPVIDIKQYILEDVKTWDIYTHETMRKLTI